MSSERLIELIKNNNIQMARTLARGIRQNDEIIHIKERDCSVKIEFNNFIGIHDIKIVSDGNKVIKPEGIYKLKSNEVNFEITCNIRKEVLKEVYNEINDIKEEEPEEKEIVKPEKEINRENNQNMKLLTRFIGIITSTILR